MILQVRNYMHFNWKRKTVLPTFKKKLFELRWKNRFSIFSGLTNKE